MPEFPGRVTSYLICSIIVSYLITISERYRPPTKKSVTFRFQNFFISPPFAFFESSNILTSSSSTLSCHQFHKYTRQNGTESLPRLLWWSGHKLHLYELDPIPLPVPNLALAPCEFANPLSTLVKYLIEEGYEVVAFSKSSCGLSAYYGFLVLT